MKPLPHSNESHRIKEVVDSNEAAQDRTDYVRLEMQEEEINYSDMPETDAAFWQNAQVTDPGPKKAIPLRIDAEVV